MKYSTIYDPELIFLICANQVNYYRFHRESGINYIPKHDRPIKHHISPSV